MTVYILKNDNGKKQGTLLQNTVFFMQSPQTWVQVIVPCVI